MAVDTQVIRTDVSEQVAELAVVLDANPERLLHGDTALSAQALAAAKEIFDMSEWLHCSAQQTSKCADARKQPQDACGWLTPTCDLFSIRFANPR